MKWLMAILLNPLEVATMENSLCPLATLQTVSDHFILLQMEKELHIWLPHCLEDRQSGAAARKRREQASRFGFYDSLHVVKKRRRHFPLAKPVKKQLSGLCTCVCVCVCIGFDYPLWLPGNSLINVCMSVHLWVVYHCMSSTIVSCD